jgi:hypothetical protein
MSKKIKAPSPAGLRLWRVELHRCNLSLWITTHRDDLPQAFAKAQAFLAKRRDTLAFSRAVVGSIKSEGTIDA